MDKFICIHGHFYQPPRENPWLEEVERQDSAYPYHDWNELVTAECYAPNAAARILGEKERISEIVNNYSKISFNFGPTLLSWLEKKVPDVYQAVLQADRLSQEKFSGHGSALAQVYNHMIMPLANRRDKETQVIWGIRDFEHRFERRPEGLWLSETAVDLETLEVLAEQGIRFTILAANQAQHTRKIGDKKWKNVGGSKVDPRRPYQCALPSGKSLVIFFYDSPVAHEVAFGPLLRDGEKFAERLLGLFNEHGGAEAELVHIATDGETYGHHHRYGDMALAYCLNYIESRAQARITVYGEYLDLHSPTHEVEIFENTSWSCFHGLERWRGNCGCNSGLNPGFSQAWRGPLRAALDELRDDMLPIFENSLKSLIKDPWQARNEYIDVILDRAEPRVEEFLQRQAGQSLSHPDKVKTLKLLEMQRHAMLMFTSCGWFFDEISGIETLQVLQYAARAMQLAREVAGADLQKYFLGHLQEAASNRPQLGNGERVWNKFVEPIITDLFKVSAHYAVSLIFDHQGQDGEKVYCYSADWETHDYEDQGEQKLITGRMRVRSDVTWETNRVVFAILHIGAHNLLAAIGDDQDDERFATIRGELTRAFQAGEIPEVIRLLDQHFGQHNYSLWHLFKDEQRRILNMIMQTALSEAETYFRHIYEHHYPIIQLMNKMNLSLPKILSTTIEFVLNTDIAKLLAADPVDTNELRKRVEEMQRWDFKRDKQTLEFMASQAITRMMAKLAQDPRNQDLLVVVEETLTILRVLELDLNTWEAQNFYHAIQSGYLVDQQAQARDQDQSAIRWVDLFGRLGLALGLDNREDQDHS